MIVSEILSKNKNKSIVVLENGIAFVLYKGDFRKYHVISGEELPEDDYREIMDEILPKRALDRSYNLLMARDYTEKQLGDKLSADGYPPEIIGKTTERLKNEKYIDDRRFTENYIFWKAKSKSRRQLLADLRMRGINDNLAGELYDELLCKNDIDCEEVRIKQILDKKKINTEELSYEERNKVTAMLMRKGFAYDAVNRVLHNRFLD